MSQEILHTIDAIAPRIAGKKLLLVRDSAYEFLGIKAFFDAIPHTEFSAFTPNPLYEQVVAGVNTFRENGCEIIVAVGGGSTMDVAKCIKLFCRMNHTQSYLKQEKTDTGVPLIAIPTTAGTGSESTRHAVIYDQGVKQSISHESIVPNIVVLEPSVLKTLPIYQKKCTMLDALAQAIESWWSVHSNEESIGYSKQAIAAIKEHWEDYIFRNTEESAKHMMEAANNAGKAINITATTAAHAMSYKITSLYRFPHGHAVAVCLPEVWAYLRSHTDLCTDSRGEAYLKQTLEAIASMIDPDEFQLMLEKMEIPYPQPGNRQEELELLVHSVNPERLQNYPARVSDMDLRQMYERILRK